MTTVMDEGKEGWEFEENEFYFVGIDDVLDSEGEPAGIILRLEPTQRLLVVTR